MEAGGVNYCAHYDRLMSRARGRVLVGYKERHHVLPRCMGGGNEPENIVKLTAEEHYVAHQLLVKMHPEVHGLAIAAFRMAKPCTGNKAYGWMQRRHALAVAAHMRGNQNTLGKRHSPETRAKISAALKGRPGRCPTLETRAKLSIARRLRVTSAETRAKMSAALMGNKYAMGNKNRLGRTHSLASKLKMSLAKMGSKHARKRAEISADGLED